jgi:hypothetical protein
MHDATPLPYDVNGCHSLIVEQARALTEIQQSRQQLSQENEELKLTIAKLLERLRGHRSERVIQDPNVRHD